MNEKDKEINQKAQCRHALNPSVYFNGRNQIEILRNPQGNYEFIDHNGSRQPLKLQFCTKCGQVLVKL